MPHIKQQKEKVGLDILVQHGLIKKMARKSGTNAKHPKEKIDGKALKMRLAKIRQTADILKNKTDRSRSLINYSSYLASDHNQNPQGHE